MSEIKRTKLTGEITISEAEFNEISSIVKNASDVAEMLLERLEKKDTTKSISFLLASAILLDASDIHTEPEEEQVRVRFRIDGILKGVAVITPADY